jgi:hypothetical protein
MLKHAKAKTRNFGTHLPVKFFQNLKTTDELVRPKSYLVTKTLSIYLGVLTDKMLQFVGATVFRAVSESVRDSLISK